MGQCITSVRSRSNGGKQLALTSHKRFCLWNDLAWLTFTHLLTLRFNGLLEPQLDLPSAIC